MRSAENALKLYLKEPRRVDKAIPLILQPLNTKLENSAEYAMIVVNDYIEDMSRSQRHRYLLHLQRGMFVPIFHYTWTWGGSRSGVNLHVIWRVPPLSDKKARDEGMHKSQYNI